MSKSFTVDQGEVRKVVKRVVERSASGQPIAYPNSNSEEGPSIPMRDEKKAANPPKK